MFFKTLGRRAREYKACSAAQNLAELTFEFVHSHLDDIRGNEVYRGLRRVIGKKARGSMLN